MDVQSEIVLHIVLHIAKRYNRASRGSRAKVLRHVLGPRTPAVFVSVSLHIGFILLLALLRLIVKLRLLFLRQRGPGLLLIEQSKLHRTQSLVGLRPFRVLGSMHGEQKNNTKHKLMQTRKQQQQHVLFFETKNLRIKTTTNTNKKKKKFFVVADFRVVF